MTKYAVVKINGHQYKLGEESVVTVDHLPQKEGEEVKLTEVLLLVDDGKVEIGQPVVDKTQVVAKVLGEVRGPKIRVLRYRAKTRYHKTKGSRSFLTKIKVESIGGIKETKSEPKEKKAKTVVCKTSAKKTK